ncbi:unnamed protein product [Vitrella brassicaformis CCMP3155]|uniref:Uncharacterized protein n=2 Tax=Vitrella brassicaformis TaxID=1169539 RepID=A0A0G4EI77_VITBC|nr:unnamed protein product [Vitrella brassicaformis CCMP3155]|eukprot:CEL95686.1 unnamed protein product [Vitrella brassicaformis CCMP3155]
MADQAVVSGACFAFSGALVYRFTVLAFGDKDDDSVGVAFWRLFYVLHIALLILTVGALIWGRVKLRNQMVYAHNGGRTRTADMYRRILGVVSGAICGLIGSQIGVLTKAMVAAPAWFDPNCVPAVLVFICSGAFQMYYMNDDVFARVKSTDFLPSFHASFGLAGIAGAMIGFDDAFTLGSVYIYIGPLFMFVGIILMAWCPSDSEPPFFSAPADQAAVVYDQELGEGLVVSEGIEGVVVSDSSPYDSSPRVPSSSAEESEGLAVSSA